MAGLRPHRPFALLGRLPHPIQGVLVLVGAAAAVALLVALVGRWILPTPFSGRPGAGIDFDGAEMLVSGDVEGSFLVTTFRNAAIDEDRGTFIVLLSNPRADQLMVTGRAVAGTAATDGTVEVVVTVAGQSFYSKGGECTVAVIEATRRGVVGSFECRDLRELRSEATVDVVGAFRVPGRRLR